MTQDVDKEALAALMNAKWEFCEAEAAADYNGELLAFNTLGDQGWELVSVVQNDDYWNGVFKRRKL